MTQKFTWHWTFSNQKRSFSMLVRTEMLKFSSWTCLSNLAIEVLSYTCVVSVLFAGEQEEESPWEWCCTPEDLLPIIIFFEPPQNQSWTHSRWFRLWFKRVSLLLNSRYLISFNSRLNQIAVLWFTYMYSEMNY